MSEQVNEFQKDSPLKPGTSAALAKMVGGGNVSKAADAMKKRSQGDTVPSTVDIGASEINNIVLDIINHGGTPGVDRLLRLRDELKAKSKETDIDEPANDDGGDEVASKRRKSEESIELESLELDELKLLAGLVEFDSSMSSRAQQVGRDVGSTTTGQQFGQAADDIEGGKTTLSGKALEAIKPYIKYISFIMTQPELFSKFKTLIMQANKQMKAQPAESVDLSDVRESLAYGMPEESGESETVTYVKTKTDGDAEVTVSANAKSMDQLHDVLKLAGITLPKSDKHDDEEHDHEEVDPFDKDGDDVCDGCGREIVDGECGCDDHDHGGDDEKAVVIRPDMSTDKQVLVNYLKDKLAKRLS